jgi:hypothetical protein
MSERYDISDILRYKHGIHSPAIGVNGMRNVILYGYIPRFRVNILFIGTFDPSDVSIVNEAVSVWKSKISGFSFPEFDHDMEISIYMTTQNENILASAATTHVKNGIPYKGNVWLNSVNWDSQKQFIKETGLSNAYYTLLHELGHVFGIGTEWSRFITDGFYYGENAVREYRKAFNNNNLIALPIEDNGGQGTAGGHPEEGVEGELSTNSRMLNGILHPGLDNELMTGWAETTNINEPLSNITIGFLDDLGYSVVYNQTPQFVPSNDGYLSPNETLFIKYDDQTFSVNYNFDQDFAECEISNPNTVSLRVSSGTVILHQILLQFNWEPTTYYIINSLSNNVSDHVLDSSWYDINLSDYNSVYGGVQKIKIKFKL